MAPAAWAIVGFVGFVILLGLGRLWWVWRKRFYIPWDVIGPGLEAFRRAPDSVSYGRISAAVDAARAALVRNGPWSPDAVRRATRELRIFVLATESWKNLQGREVAGEQLGPVLYVGPSLSALCHEMAHRCEELLGRGVDLAHVSWFENGIRAAIAEYEAWLASGPSP